MERSEAIEIIRTVAEHSTLFCYRLEERKDKKGQVTVVQTTKISAKLVGQALDRILED